MTPRLPSTTYADAINRLNAKSLRHSLEVVCLLSCMEFMGGHNSPVFPLVNNEKVRLLAEAVVKSKAAWYKDRPISPKDLPTLLNGANSALEDKRLQEEVVSGGERQEMLYGLQRFFARVAYLQLRAQQSPVMPLGQLFAIIEVLPTKHWMDLPEHIQCSARKFPATVAGVLGTTATDLLTSHGLLINYFEKLGQLVLGRLPHTPMSSFTVSWQAKTLASLLSAFNSQLDYFRLTPGHFERMYGRTAVDRLEKYAHVFARSIQEHRKLLSEPQYQVGSQGLRLSSLDRFPLIAADEPHVWYAPNVRLLTRAAPEVIHFTLNEHCRRVYEQVRGPLLELYLTKLVKTRAPTLIVIPEEKWRTGKGDVAGPDLVIIDHGPNPSVLGIEVKFRRMLPPTRFELGDEDLTANYEDLWKAIKALPDKLVHVFALAGGYQKYHAELERARHYPRWNVGLAGEAPFMFGELTLFRATNDHAFPLFGFREPWAVMAVECFERFVEVVVQCSSSVAKVLSEYQEDCADMELSGSMADSFKNIELREEQSYAASLLRGI